MSDDAVPRLDVVTALERELSSTGAVMLTPSSWRVIGSQAPALIALGLGAFLTFQAVADGGTRPWLVAALFLATGAFGLWQVCVGLWGHGRRPVRVTADGLHDDATGGHVAWADILEVHLDDFTVRGITFRRWVELVVPPPVARGWLPARTRIGSFAGDLREDADTRLDGTSRIELPASLPDPVSLRAWLSEEVRRRTAGQP